MYLKFGIPKRVSFFFKSSFLLVYLFTNFFLALSKSVVHKTLQFSFFIFSIILFYTFSQLCPSLLCFYPFLSIQTWLQSQFHHLLLILVQFEFQFSHKMKIVSLTKLLIMFIKCLAYGRHSVLVLLPILSLSFLLFSPSLAPVHNNSQP